MKRSFLICGSIGWCLEIFWTGFHSLLKGEPTMIGKSSLLMFPIYGLACFIRPFSRFFRRIPKFFRGCIYTVCIFYTEYLTGSFLKKHKMCPWDYSKCPFNFHGVIRLDYAPIWFFTGLFYEKILQKIS